MTSKLFFGLVLLFAGCSSSGTTTTGSGAGMSTSSAGGTTATTGVTSTATGTTSSTTGTATATGTSTSTGGMTMGLSIMGNQLMKDGMPFRVHGVNRSGSEYACIQGNGFFDGPVDDAAIASIVSWKANAVRVPLNEDCWLAINNAPAQYSGAAYQTAIHDFVARLNAHGLVAILELHWSAAGTAQATKQDPMPNKDHSITFWSQVAAAYKSTPYVLFEPFNEPFPDSNQDTAAAWTCWKSGGTCPGASYQTAGMQDLVDAIRGAGATQPILLGGIEYSNCLTHWLQNKPTDPLNQLAAAWHVYDFNTCNNTNCYDTQAGPVAASVPIVTTEIGEDDCSGTFITTLMGWLDQKGQGYLGWVWDTWGGCLVLINNYDGTPAGTYGQTYHDHLATF